ncbi:MAG: MptD family putative ECF transporter S component [Spirochaetales bacterium]
MKDKTKLKTKDLIYAGAFAALYMITMIIVIMVLGMFPILYFMLPLFVGIVAATVYMMYVTKVKKMGAILILAVMFGLIMSSSGHGLAILITVPIGILAEIIAKLGNYQSQKMFSLSYIVFNLTMVTPYNELYLGTAKFLDESRVNYGDNYADTIQNVLNTYGVWLIIFQVLIAMVGAVIGVVLAAKLFKKHFIKSGIV